MEEEALAQLGEIGEEASLRHAVHLLTPAHVLAKSNGRDAVSSGDVEEVCTSPLARTYFGARAFSG